MEENKKTLLKNIIWTVLYAIFTLIIVLHHETWADEAQVWQLVRHLNVFELLKHLVNEGHPSFFYLLMMPFAKMHLPVMFMQIFCWLCAVAGVFLFMQFSPFGRFAKFAIVTSAGFLYFFPVIARSYSILPLLVFSLAILYPKAHKHPFLYASLIFMLANTHIIMLVFCGFLTLDFLYSNLIKIRKEIDKDTLKCTRKIRDKEQSDVNEFLECHIEKVSSDGSKARDGNCDTRLKKYAICFGIMCIGLLAVVLQLHGTTSSNVVIKIDTTTLTTSIIKVLSQFFINAVDNQWPELGKIMFPLFNVPAIMLCALIYIVMLVILLVQDKKLFAITFFSIIFQLTVYIIGYNHWVFVNRIFCAHIILLFAFWVLMNQKELSLKTKKSINICLSIFFIFMLMNGLKYCILDVKYNYSSAIETAKYIEKNIDPKDSILITDNDPHVIGLVYYFDGKRNIYSVAHRYNIKYVVWDKELFYILSKLGWAKYTELELQKNPDFRNKKIYAIIPAFDTYKMGVTEVKDYKLIFQSSPAIVKYEGFRIYEYIGHTK